MLVTIFCIIIAKLHETNCKLTDKYRKLHKNNLYTPEPTNKGKLLNCWGRI